QRGRSHKRDETSREPLMLPCRSALSGFEVQTAQSNSRQNGRRIFIAQSEITKLTRYLMSPRTCLRQRRDERVVDELPIDQPGFRDQIGQVKNRQRDKICFVPM